MTNLSNPILQQAEDMIETHLTPDNRQNYMKIVAAGLHVALDGGPDSLMAKLRQSQDPVADAAKGAVSLVIILRKQAKGVMPVPAMVPAAMTLMLTALDFLGRSKTAEIGQAELVRATHIFADTVFARFNITKQGLSNAAARVHSLIQDPQAMNAINLKAGIMQHPNASTPTPIPEG